MDYGLLEYPYFSSIITLNILNSYRSFSAAEKVEFVFVFVLSAYYNRNNLQTAI